MKLEYIPLTEIEKQRSDCFKQRMKPGMTIAEVMELNDEILHMFPPTQEERQLKFERLKGIPEFVL